MICLICGRKLSSPKSIELGYGPVCYEKVSGSSKAARKSKTEKFHQEAESTCYDIPGQMELKDYLSDL